MELIYLYVQDSDIFRDFELNFCSQLRFRLLPGEHPSFECVSGDELPPRWFSLSSTGSGVAVSAIVGANGAGKTSIAHVMEQILSRDTGLGNFAVALSMEPGVVDFYFSIIGFSSDGMWRSGKSMSVERIGPLPTVRCDPPVNVQQGLAVTIRKHSLSTEEDFNCLREKLTMVYYSPLYTTQHPFLLQKSYFRDISTTAVLKSAGGRIVSDELKELADEIRPSDAEAVDTIQMLEMAVRLYQEKNIPSDMKFPIPVACRVSRNAAVASIVADYWERRRNDPVVSEVLDGLVRENVLGIEMDVGQIVRQVFGPDTFSSNDFCVKTFLLYAFMYWRDVGAEEAGTDGVGKPLLDLALRLYARCESEDQTEANQKNAREWLADRLKGCKDSAPRDVRPRWEQICKVFEICRHAFAMQQSFVMGFPRDAGDESEIFELIAAHEGMRVKTPLLRFALVPHLSTGEMSFMTLWGRLWSVYRQMCADRQRELEHPEDADLTLPDDQGARMRVPTNTRDLLVFFDEAETALHPNLQRQLVYLSIWFFETFLPHVRPHLVFASHSPFLLSDIPKGNVCFLQRDGEGVRVSELHGLENTFGANIFDLYRHPFFMENGMVGAFASTKLDNVVRKARRIVQEHSKEKMSVGEWSVTKMVGDPQARRYFQSLEFLIRQEQGGLARSEAHQSD